jgi:hypothetical protein
MRGREPRAGVDGGIPRSSHGSRELAVDGEAPSVVDRALGVAALLDCHRATGADVDRPLMPSLDADVTVNVKRPVDLASQNEAGTGRNADRSLEQALVERRVLLDGPVTSAGLYRLHLARISGRPDAGHSLDAVHVPDRFGQPGAHQLVDGLPDDQVAVAVGGEGRERGRAEPDGCARRPVNQSVCRPFLRAGLQSLHEGRAVAG